MVILKENEKGMRCPRTWVLRRIMGQHDPKISELTVSELQQLIRATVQEAVAEVIIEFNAAAAAEEQLRYEAEITDFLRNTMQGNNAHFFSGVRLDD